MPPNTVKVDRTTKWGNPFIVGENGTRADCVNSYRMLLAGYMCVSRGAECAYRQKKSRAYIEKHLQELRGKNLACWCPLGQPCHADVLLEAANKKDQVRDE